jgi:DNA-binding transcriptional LysR family regulator
MPSVEFRLLRSFVAVADTLSFTHAAGQLHVAQPALSRQIQQLEREIGVQLFVRDRRSVRLTDAGHTLLEEARLIVAQASHFQECARRAQRGASGLVRIATSYGWMRERLDRVLAKHAKEFPGVEIEHKYVPCDLQSAALLDGQVDVGIMRPPIDREGLLSQLLFEESFLALLSSRHPLAKGRHLKLQQLAGDTLLLPERSPLSALHDKTLELYRMAGVDPKIVHAALWPHDDALWLLLQSGRGIALAPAPPFSRTVVVAGVAFVPLDEPRQTIPVHVAWRRGERSPTVTRFLNSVRRMLKPGDPATTSSQAEVHRMFVAAYDRHMRHRSRDSLGERTNGVSGARLRSDG